MGLIEIVIWLIFGGLAGWIASLLVGKDAQMGVVANIVTGIVGAFIGGVILPNDADTFDIGSFVAAVIGAVLLLLVVNWVLGRSNRPRV